MILTKSRTQLVNEAASKLQAVGSGQAVEAEDQATIDDKVDPLILQLAVDSICNVDNDEEIPGEWFDAIACLLANNCADDFGKEYDPAKKALYEAQLRRLTAPKTTREPVVVEYF